LILAVFFDFMERFPISVEAFFERSVFYVLWVFPVTLANAIFLGLPVAIICRARRWTHWSVAIVGGFLIGVVPVGLFGLWANDGRLNGLVGAVPLIGFAGGFGASGALAFWLTLKLCGELTPGDSDSAEVSAGPNHQK
jgi:hypothetical protein